MAGFMGGFTDRFVYTLNIDDWYFSELSRVPEFFRTHDTVSDNF